MLIESAAVGYRFNVTVTFVLDESSNERSYNRVDSVIESSLREIIVSKNFALVNLSLNFCQTTINDQSNSRKFCCRTKLYEIITDFLKCCPRYSFAE